MKKILKSVLIRFAATVVFTAAVIMLPSGSLKYWNGWLYIGTILLLMVTGLCLLYKNDPVLLEKRMDIREKQKEQKVYVKISVFWFLVSFIIPGLDYRFQWSHVPLWLVIISLAVMILAYVMFIVVMMQNSYASRVIEIQDGQKLIDKGLYSVVRHPMYLAAAILYLASPLVLGSYYALIPLAMLPLLLAFRIRHEEKMLMEGLEGYREYTRRVRYRLVPFIW